MLETIRGNLRQFIRYKKEFRIAAPRWPELTESIEDIITLLEAPLSKTKISSEKEKGLLSLAVEMGTSVWRLQRRLTMEDEMPEEIRRVSRDLESAWNALRQEDIEIKDHTGEKYYSGMALRVIEFQPTEDVKEEEIIETVKPTIYHKNKLVQIGEVIVGVPETNTKTETPEQK
jgi:hypothetical protein